MQNNRLILSFLILTLIAAGLLLMQPGVLAQSDDDDSATAEATAEPMAEPTAEVTAEPMVEATAEAVDEVDEDVLAHGRYLAVIAGCISCHTPYDEKYDDLDNLSEEDLKALGLREHNALDLEDRLMGGGRVFDLGPMGVITSANITPDVETGIGAWSAEELEIAIRTGITPEGRQMVPLMPYQLYNQMADSDMDALIAYLQFIDPVENEIPPSMIFVPSMGFEMPEAEIIAPDPADAAARGSYLMTAVLPCSDCHTPLDPETGLLWREMWLAGGQPYEGPWGIVYGANITPHDESGIGTWSDNDIFRVLSAGVREDGRRVVLMPWQDYTVLTGDDAAAVVTYLRNLEPIDNEVPDPALDPLFIETIELAD